MLQHRRLPLALVLLPALWLLARPWEGIWHDARLYAAQALRQLHPAQFQHDIYFLYGSQDAYTLFSPLYAACIDVLGLQPAALLLHSAGAVLWLGAAIFLLRAFERGLHTWTAMALLLLLPSDYGPTHDITLAEPFLTPRIFAEALGMLAIGCGLRRQWWRAGLALAGAFLLHPLISLGVVLFGVLFLGAAQRRLAALVLTAGAAAVIGAALLNIGPAGRLLQTMDDFWLAQAVAWTPMVTWEAWRFSEWGSRLAVSFSLVCCAAWLSEGWRSRFYWSAALAGALGMLASWAGTGLLHNLLLIQLQPWRVLWLLQLTAAIALAQLLLAYRQSGRLCRLLLMAFGVAILTRDSFGGLLAMGAAVGLCLDVRRSIPVALDLRSYRLVQCLLLALAASWVLEVSGGQGVVFINPVAATPQGLQWIEAWIKYGGAAVLALPLLLLIWHWSGSSTRGRYLAALALAALCLGGALALAKLRHNVWSAQQMSDAGRRAILAKLLPHIPPQSVVYWQDNASATWLLLQRSNYASRLQMAGLPFNRGTAVEGMRRLQRLRQFGMPDAVRGRNWLDAAQAGAGLARPSQAGLAYLCADPVLDFVVLDSALAPAPLARASDPVRGRNYYLYDCVRLRAGQ